MLLQAEAARAAFDDLALSATLDPGDPDTLDALERAAGQAERVGEAIAVLERLADSPAGRVTARVALARLLASTGRVDAALQRVAEAIAAAPGDPRPLRQQASIFADLGDAVRLEPVVRRLETLAPGDVESLYYGATLALLTSRSGDAIRLAEQALKKDPAHARLQNLLGAAQAGVGGIDAARAAFQSSIEHNPKDPTAYVNLGSLELQAANATRAGGYFAEALALDPGSAAAREGLARAFELTGNHGRAERVRRGAPTTSGS
jgi:Flp pilus assembly protein TadD